MNSTAVEGSGGQRGRVGLRLLACGLFATVFVALERPALAGRDDIVVLLAPDGVAEMVLNGFPLNNTVTQGVLSLETDDVGCVALPTHPCHYVLNILRTTISTFEFSGQTVGDPVAIVTGPLAVEDHGEGILVPPGTPVLVGMTLGGDRRGVPSTTPSGITIMLNVPEQKVAITGAFTGSLEGVTVDATLLATGLSPFANLPPVANAGPDQTITCGATTHLDGSGTTDPNNNLVLLSWSDAGSVLGFGPKVDVRLGPGVHNVLLEAFDQFEGRGVDSSTVTVVPDTTPPTFIFVPGPLTINSCAAPDIGRPVVSDDCGVVSLTNDAPAVFPLGETTVTWTATDAAGNKSVAIEKVVAELADDPSCCPAGTHVIIGTNRSELIKGTEGSDCILGLGGSDTILGLGGDDFISGGRGDDRIFGDGRCEGKDDHDRDHDNDHRCRPSSSPQNDYLAGGPGDDTLVGEKGNDILIGGPGCDHLQGGSGNDRLSGGEGDDHLDGDSGTDALDGGKGRDVCEATKASTVIACERRQIERDDDDDRDDHERDE
jgi:hypothetical protein